MTADDLMRLIGRYTEACDDMEAGLFEQTTADTDAKHGKATFLHGQILAEVYRLHADAAQARQTAEHWKTEHLAGDTRIGELHDEAEQMVADEKKAKGKDDRGKAWQNIVHGDLG